MGAWEHVDVKCLYTRVFRITWRLLYGELGTSTLTKLRNDRSSLFLVCFLSRRTITSPPRCTRLFPPPFHRVRAPFARSRHLAWRSKSREVQLLICRSAAENSSDTGTQRRGTPWRARYLCLEERGRERERGKKHIGICVSVYAEYAFAERMEKCGAPGIEASLLGALK